MKRITAPNEEFTGKVGAVQFVDGVAETDDLAVINYCEGAGYKVEAAGGKDEDGGKAPSRSSSKADWVAYATSPEVGMAQAEAEGMTRDQLADKFIGPKAE